MEFKVPGFKDLALGEQSTMDAGILCITLNEMEASVTQPNDVVNFKKINRILRGCIPEIVDRGGMVLSYDLSGAMSLFLNKPADALSCALSIFSKIEQLSDDKKRIFENISMACCYGSVTVGMVGFGEYATPLAGSESVRLCRRLQKRASAYSSRILVTETFFDLIPSAKERYNHRMLGVVYLSHSRKKEVIFDVFESDEPNIRNIKRRTKNMFEKGVEMFLVHRFADARNYFLEVIRTDRRDLAAKEYLLRCDDFIHDVTDSKAESAIYIEIL